MFTRSWSLERSNWLSSLGAIWHILLLYRTE